LLLAQDEIELWMVMVRFVIFGPECDQNSVLKEIIKLDGIRVEALAFQIVNTVKN
jgi:hypothetical protein